jgi:hypothetical protein
LIVDDFADLTTELVQSAYIEALYLADEWDFTRLTYNYWSEMLKKTSQSGNIDYMLTRHPMEAGMS